MNELIEQRIKQLEAERDQFAQIAPIRAEERMQALQTQLQIEISMRLQTFEAQIAVLQQLLAEPAKEND